MRVSARNTPGKTARNAIATCTKRRRDSLFAAIAKTLRSILSFDRPCLSIYDPVDDLLKGFAVSGITAQRAAFDAGINVPRQGSMMERAVDQKRPIIDRDLRQKHPESVDANIITALETTGWRVSGARKAAKLLGIKPTTLEARMKKPGMERKR